MRKAVSFLYCKNILLACIGFILPAFCCAQQKAVYKPTVGLTFLNTTIKDAGMSALTYTGWYPGATAGLDINSKALRQNIALSYAAGNLKNDLNTATVSAKYFSANYLALFPVKQGKIQLSVGGIFNNSLATRRHSAFVNYKRYFEFNSSLGLAAKISYLFGDAGNADNANRLSFGLFSPLVSALSRSNSVYNQDNDFLSPQFKTYLKNTRIVTFGHYAKINMHTEFENQTGALKGLSVGYNWEYYKISEVNAVQSAVNTVSVSYHF